MSFSKNNTFELCALCSSLTTCYRVSLLKGLISNRMKQRLLYSDQVLSDSIFLSLNVFFLNIDIEFWS